MPQPPPLSIRQLDQVRVIARERSFVRAAAWLNISPSALSHSIKSLETSLSFTLFQRSRSGVVSTPQGEQIVNHAIAVLSELGALGDTVGRIASGSEGEVAFGLGLYPASILLKPLMERIIQRYPKLECRAEVRPPLMLGQSLRTASIDFAIFAERNVPAHAEALGGELLSIPLAALVRPEHPLASRTKVKMQDVQNYPLLLSHMADEDIVTFAQMTLNVRGQPLHLVEDVQASAALARLTDCVWLMAPWQEEVTDGLAPLAIADMEGHLPAIKLVAIKSRGRELANSARTVLSELRMTIEELERRPRPSSSFTMSNPAVG